MDGIGWRARSRFSTCVTPSSVISCILQQEPMIRMAVWSTTSTFQSIPLVHLVFTMSFISRSRQMSCSPGMAGGQLTA